MPEKKNITIIYGGNNSSQEAKEIAAKVDVCVVVVATFSSEGTDRTTLSVGDDYDNLVQLVASQNKRVIVIARCPGPCIMPWKDLVSGIIFAGYQGQEAGNALANVMFGSFNPSAKLTLSFPNSMQDTWLSLTPGGPVDPVRYPGTDRGNGYIEADYSEGLFMGYRYYDHMQLNPLWPFGYGLSYTNFSYSNLTINPTNITLGQSTKITFTVKNTGPFEGSEISQLYVTFPDITNEPPQLLKGFAKTLIKVGQQSNITIELNAKDLMVFDEGIDDWILVSGKYQIRVGTSSRNISLTDVLLVQI